MHNTLRHTAILLILAYLAGLAAVPVTAQAPTGQELVYDVTVYQTVTLAIDGRPQTVPVFYGRYLVTVGGTGEPRITVLAQETIAVTGAVADYRRLLQAFNPGPGVTVGVEKLSETVYYVVDGSRLPYKCTEAIRVDSRIGTYYYTPDGVLVYAVTNGPNMLSEAILYHVFPASLVQDVNTTISIMLVKSPSPVCGSQAGGPMVLAALGLTVGLVIAGVVYSYTAWRSRIAESLWSIQL